jgi:hypothetical protein
LEIVLIDINNGCKKWKPILERGGKSLLHPGCLTAAITLPGGGAALVTTTITYILRCAQDRPMIPSTA